MIQFLAFHIPVRWQKHLLIGVSSLRHHLTHALEHHGGHIGYAIRPSERRKGYGTRLLAMTLDQHAMGFRRVLVTCDTDHIASARVIEKKFYECFWGCGRFWFAGRVSANPRRN